MSTTVSYKGNTIATLSNETKTLTTAGTWVEADIVVTDSGGSSTAIIADTTDAAGGTVRTITTTDEVHLQTKTITPTSSQQTVLPDTGYDGFSSVIVGASSGGTPSATAHTIYFEFSDNTNTTITAYYDNSFISSAITATTPTTYGNKTVTLAQLDNVTWYDPSEQWETLFEGTTQLVQDTPYPYWWISSLSSTNISVGSVWRVTMDGVESGRLTATNSEYGGMIGNPLYVGGSDDGSGLKYGFFNAGWGAWSGGADMTVGNHTVKIERLVTS